MASGWKPTDNPKLLDGTAETFWRQVRQAVDQVMVNHDHKVTIETQGKRVAVMSRLTEAGNMIYIAITEVPAEQHIPPTLIAP